jgi:nucleotide-binding universal stress UspA family protein
MKQIERILALTDLSERSLAGLSYALDLANTLGAELTVLHVLGYADFANYGKNLSARISKDPGFRVRVSDGYLHADELALRRFLEKHFKDLLSPVRVRLYVAVGDVDEAIVSEAKKRKIDLVVLSGPEKTGLARFLKPDVTAKVIRKAHCPVLTIPSKPCEEGLRAA